MKILTLTCIILSTDAGVSSFPARTHSSVQARIRVAHVNLDLAVIPREAGGTATAQASDRVDGPKQHGG